MQISSPPFVSTCAYLTRSGNHVRRWIDGMPAFRRIRAAIEAAQQSAWVTITFMWPAFQMTAGHGAPLDVLERAAQCGVDVRLIFWWPDDETDARRIGWGRNICCRLRVRMPPQPILPHQVAP